MNASLIKWLSDTPHHFRDNIAYGALDLSPTYAAVYSVVVPNATQVVDLILDIHAMSGKVWG